MNDMQEIQLKAEIDEIMKSVDSVMKKIESVMPQRDKDNDQTEE